MPARAITLQIQRELCRNGSGYCSMKKVSMLANPVIRYAAAAVVASLLLAGQADAQGRATVGSAPAENPFGQLAGGWSGNGTIDLADGRKEPIKCRASYDVLEGQNKLQLNINCASESYKFELRASATYSADAITGTWSETTRNAALP